MQKIFLITIFLAAVLSLNSCMKDKDFDEHKFGLKDIEESAVGVGFPESSNDINTVSIMNESTAQNFEIALVKIFSDQPADQDLHITVESKPSLITDYNNANNGNLLPLPAAAYSITSMTAVIPKGERNATLQLVINSASTQLDITRTYALGFTIKTVQESGITIAENYKDILVGVVISNVYDGIYELRSVTAHPTNPILAGTVGPVDVALITNGATSVITGTRHAWANGSGSSLPAGYNTIFTIDPTTNNVTVSDASGIGFTNSPGYPSRYDPASRTIYAKWQYAGSGGNRVFTDTLVYQGPR